MECCGNNENNCKAVFVRETRSKRSDLLFIRKVTRLNDATNRENGFVANGDMYILKTQLLWNTSRFNTNVNNSSIQGMAKIDGKRWVMSG